MNLCALVVPSAGGKGDERLLRKHSLSSVPPSFYLFFFYRRLDFRGAFSARSSVRTLANADAPRFAEPAGSFGELENQSGFTDQACETQYLQKNPPFTVSYVGGHKLYNVKAGPEFSPLLNPRIHGVLQRKATSKVGKLTPDTTITAVFSGAD